MILKYYVRDIFTYVHTYKFHSKCVVESTQESILVLPACLSVLTSFFTWKRRILETGTNNYIMLFPLCKMQNLKKNLFGIYNWMNLLYFYLVHVNLCRCCSTKWKEPTNLSQFGEKLWRICDLCIHIFFLIQTKKYEPTNKQTRMGRY